MSYFFIDDASGGSWTYKVLLRDLNSINKGLYYVYESDAYSVLVRLIHSLAAGYPITLLDSYLSREEISFLGIDDSVDIHETFPISPLQLTNFDDLIEQINQQKKNWSLGLFTSGTTGRPKHVYQTFDVLTRNVKTGIKHASDIWGFAYNPTHIAGVQVFLQALLNQNPLVYLFDENKLSIRDLIRRYGITHISATPTYFRTVLVSLTDKIPTVRNITFGGERYDPQLASQLQSLFPNASIRNIYASTELGTLLKTEGDIFTVPPALRKDIRISDEMELLIHHQFLGNVPKHELQLVDGIWYATGDMVEQVGTDQFKIIHRKTELINVGGYKVNPIEVEQEIKKIRGVIDVAVKGKSNKITGHVLVAEIVIHEDASKELITKKMMNGLQLQPWKVPRQIYYVDTLQENRFGKKSRQ